jgi:hypothetical protein
VPYRTSAGAFRKDCHSGKPEAEPALSGCRPYPPQLKSITLRVAGPTPADTSQAEKHLLVSLLVVLVAAKENPSEISPLIT